MIRQNVWIVWAGKKLKPKWIPKQRQRSRIQIIYYVIIEKQPRNWKEIQNHKISYAYRKPINQVLLANVKFQYLLRISWFITNISVNNIDLYKSELYASVKDTHAHTQTDYNHKWKHIIKYSYWNRFGIVSRARLNVICRIFIWMHSLTAIQHRSDFALAYAWISLTVSWFLLLIFPTDFFFILLCWNSWF